MDDKNFYGVFKKEMIDDVKEKIERMLNGEELEEAEKFSVIKQVHEFMNIHDISDEFKQKMRFDEIIEKETELYKRISSYGRD